MTSYLATPLVIFAIICLASCSHKKADAISPQKILSWSEFADLDRHPLPYTEMYRCRDQNVLYVAAQHTNDPTSETFGLIQRAFADHSFDVLIVEGFPRAFGNSPENILRFALSVDGTPSDSEIFFATRMSSMNSTEFTGAEATDAQIAASFLQDGGSPEDLFGFYVLRLLEPWLQQQKISGLSDPRLREELKTYTSVFSAAAKIAPSQIEELASLNGFEAWYGKLNGLPFEDSYRPEDVWPAGSISKPRASNHLSDQIADIRETAIAATIADHINRGLSVLIVYGGSHHVIQEPMFETCETSEAAPTNKFGEPEERFGK